MKRALPRLSLASTVALFPVQALAQSAPAFVACVWADQNGKVVEGSDKHLSTSGGRAEIFKITESSWLVWSYDDLKWLPRSCGTAADDHIMTVTGAYHDCSTEVTASNYRWNAKNGNDYMHFTANLTIDRQSGGASVIFTGEYLHLGEWKPIDYSGRILAGTCKKAADPEAALPQPKL